MKNNFSYSDIPKITTNDGHNECTPVFSFTNYCTDKLNAKYFNKNAICKKEEFINFFLGLRDFSQCKWKDIKTHHQFHYHEIDDDKNINSKLSIDETIPLVQFKFPGDKESRVIGFFDSNNIFNIVLYDYSHQIYKRK